MESPLQTIERLQQQIRDLEAQLAAAQQGVQAPFMYAIADGYGQPLFEEQSCVSSEAKDLQPEVDSLNENLDGEPPYKVIALYAHPTTQGLEQVKQAIRDYYFALDTRQHGGLAADKALKQVEQALGMQWRHGEEAELRAAQAKQGAAHG